MQKLILYVVSFGVALLIVSALWPYGNRYFINSDLKKAALYGTKHSIEDTERLLIKELKEKRFNFDPEKLSIDKNENNAVTIRLTYQDKISFFGIVLKELEFKLDVAERNVKEYL